MRPIVIDGIVVDVADLAAGTAAASTTADTSPADPNSRGCLRYLYLHRIAGILLHARGLRDARLVTANAFGEHAAYLLDVAWIRGVAAGLHLRRLAGARYLVATLGRRRDHHDGGALRLGRALQPLESVIETVLLKGFQIPELHAAHVAGEQLVGR